MLTERRERRFRYVANRRQPDLTVILENVHDMHNIGAVLRTCDSVGIPRIYHLTTRPDHRFTHFELGKRTSAGSKKWVDVHRYHDAATCMAAVREHCDHIYATHLGEDAVSLHELDLAQPVALVFGNEKDGITAETLALTDGNFIIPQVGFTQSLNISVACAVSLYEALRQRTAAGRYGDTSATGEAFYQKYKSIHEGTQP